MSEVTFELSFIKGDSEEMDWRELIEIIGVAPSDISKPYKSKGRITTRDLEVIEKEKAFTLINPDEYPYEYIVNGYCSFAVSFPWDRIDEGIDEIKGFSERMEAAYKYCGANNLFPQIDVRISCDETPESFEIPSKLMSVLGEFRLDINVNLETE